jgi:cytochrome c oxidase subunit 4
MTRAHVPLKTVLGTGVAVLVLWALSFAVSYVPMGAASLAVALGIAALKAALVALFFMELVRETLSVKLTMVGAVVMVMILMTLMVADIATRDTPPLLVPGARSEVRSEAAHH